MKRALLWSVAWILGSLLLCAAILVFVATREIGGRMTKERSAQFGQGAGIVVAMGLVPIWWFTYYRHLPAPPAASTRKKKKPGSGRKPPPG